MPTQDEINLALNKFMPNKDCSILLAGDRCRVHGFNFFADTPEAHERTDALSDKFVEKYPYNLTVSTCYSATVGRTYHARAGFRGQEHVAFVKSHAILDAIYEAIK